MGLHAQLWLSGHLTLTSIISYTYVQPNSNPHQHPVGVGLHVQLGLSGHFTLTTVEPLSNDHPHQRPSLIYDHISCDGQCFLFVWSLTNDHPSDATSDRVRWHFLPRGRPHRVFQNDCVMNVRWRAAHFTYNSNTWQYSTNTKRLRIACKSGWWCVPLILLTVNDRTSMDERKHNISTSEERIEWQTEWRRESHQLWGRQDADSRGCEG